MRSNPQDLVTCTKEIVDWKLHFFAKCKYHAKQKWFHVVWRMKKKKLIIKKKRIKGKVENLGQDSKNIGLKDLSLVYLLM